MEHLAGIGTGDLPRSARDMTGDPTLIVHRSTKEIGGNGIEIRSASGARLLLDAGRPLDAPHDGTNLLPSTLDRSGAAALLISHPHQDHYGLLAEIPTEWSVFCGEATETLIAISMRNTGERLDRRCGHWRDGEQLAIGPFRVTPHLTDHSAFDAYMLLIEVDGRRIFYSGDFRRHGRKRALVNKLMRNPPRDIDVLLLEGTNLGRAQPSLSEADLEAEFEALFKQTPGRVFIGWSPQNVDRTVTIYRACLRARRTLVLDLYSAEVLEALARHGRIPQPDWSRIKIVITKRLAARYRRNRAGALVDKYAANGMSARALAATPSRWACMIRASLIPDFEAAGVQPSTDDAWCWSLWNGYLRRPGEQLTAWFERGGTPARHIHTSGHASVDDLKALAKAIAPRLMVPIHGTAWDELTDGFPMIRRLADGEPLSLV